MKKIILALMLAITLVLSGCSYAANGDYNAGKVDSRYFDAETIETGSGYRIVRDKNTDVLYLVTYGYNAVAMTPILNADGTPLLYNERVLD